MKKLKKRKRPTGVVVKEKLRGRDGRP